MSDQPATAGAARRTKLAAGLYLVSTPIGSARDITLRALDVLLSADAIAAEDTRTARKLMEIHGVPVGGRPMIAYHDHSSANAREKVMMMIAQGQAVAYVSEAGTPLVADPGFQLARSAIAEDLKVLTAPGASAALAALCVSGLPSDRFLFAGFPPSGKSALKTWLKDLAPLRATLILYESPKRIHKLLNELDEALEEDRQIAVCRELTKKFEEVIRGRISEVKAVISERSLKGEIVVIIDRGDGPQVSAASMEEQLEDALKELSVKDAAAKVAADMGLPKRQVYQAALAMNSNA